LNSNAFWGFVPAAHISEEASILLGPLIDIVEVWPIRFNLFS
jgi:hypothetical protein